MLIAEYYAKPSKGEMLHFTLTDTHLTLGNQKSLELAEVREIKLSVWWRSGNCQVIDRAKKKITIPSTCRDHDNPESQTLEYIEFLDVLHDLLHLQTPQVHYRGRSLGSLMSGAIITILSLLACLLFVIFFPLDRYTQLNRWLLLSFGVLGACGLAVGIPLMRSARLQRYRRGMPPVHYLPNATNGELVISESLGRSVPLRSSYGRHLIQPINEPPNRKDRFEI